MNSNCRYRFLNFQTTTSCYNFATLRRVALIVRNNAGSALLSQRSREAFSGMRHTATDSATGFQREAAPFWLRRFQRQKLKRARNPVPGNNASQPVSIAKPSMMPSYDGLGKPVPAVRIHFGPPNSLPLRFCHASRPSVHLQAHHCFPIVAFCARLFARGGGKVDCRSPGLAEVCFTDLW